MSRKFNPKRVTPRYFTSGQRYEAVSKISILQFEDEVAELYTSAQIMAIFVCSPKMKTVQDAANDFFAWFCMVMIELA